MNPQELAEARAEVIERTINIEGLLDVIISQHYLGRVTRKFLFEVLYDEYFNFGLKVKIFSKIADDQAWVHKLNRLASIRNHFVHRGRLTVDFERGGDSFVPDPKKPSKPINFGDLLLEFAKLADALEPSLLNHYQRAGGRFLDERTADGGDIIYAENE